MRAVDNAKSLSAAIKFLCSVCRTVQVKVERDRIIFAQETDNKTAWIEILVELREKGATEQPLRIVDSKSLAAAVRAISTLKDSLAIEVDNEKMTVTTETSKGVRETTELKYQVVQGYKLDTSPCRPEKLIAGKVDFPTRELEAIIKAETDKVIVAKTSKGSFSLGAASMPAFAVASGEHSQGYSTATLLQLVRPALSAEVAVHVYRDLPMKLTYTISRKKGKADKDDVSWAALNVFHTPV